MVSAEEPAAPVATCDSIGDASTHLPRSCRALLPVWVRACRARAFASRVPRIPYETAARAPLARRSCSTTALRWGPPSMTHIVKLRPVGMVRAMPPRRRPRHAVDGRSRPLGAAGSEARFARFAAYVETRAEHFSWVLLADLRDVAFQAHPFAWLRCAFGPGAPPKRADALRRADGSPPRRRVKLAPGGVQAVHGRCRVRGSAPEADSQPWPLARHARRVRVRVARARRRPRAQPGLLGPVRFQLPGLQRPAGGQQQHLDRRRVFRGRPVRHRRRRGRESPSMPTGGWSTLWAARTRWSTSTTASRSWRHPSPPPATAQLTRQPTAAAASHQRSRARPLTRPSPPARACAEACHGPAPPPTASACRTMRQAANLGKLWRPSARGTPPSPSDPSSSSAPSTATPSSSMAAPSGSMATGRFRPDRHPLRARRAPTRPTARVATCAPVQPGRGRSLVPHGRVRMQRQRMEQE